MIYKVFIKGDWRKVGDDVKLGWFKRKWKILFIGMGAIVVLGRGEKRKTVICAVTVLPTEIIFGSKIYLL